MYLIDPDDLIDRAEALEPLPASTARLVSLINNPDCDVDEISKVIAFDQALTLKLLRDANSAFTCTLLQVHHAELGGLIGRRWKLPDNIVLGIMHHHTPEEGADVICDAVSLANLAAKKIEADLAKKPFTNQLDVGVSKRLGIDPAKFQELCNHCAQLFQKVAALYGVS
ncbi:MAG: HDOD domain-containing protein [Verrucomicrobia bacterium]|nr:HDOD domain-containing protein [Verrucomicrobiota bacterium]